MQSPLRRLTLAFVLAFAGPLLRPTEADEVSPVVRISSTLKRTADRTGQLSVTADVANGFQIHAQAHPRTFLATRITVAGSPVAVLRLAG